MNSTVQRRHSQSVLLLPVLVSILLVCVGCGGEAADDAVDEGGAAEERVEQPTNPIVPVLVSRAERAKNAGAYSTALTICNTIADQAPEYDYGHFLRGQVLTSLHRYEDARAAFERVLERNPAFPAIRFTLGNNAVQRGAYREALEHFRAERDATSADDPLAKRRATLLQLGRTYEELGRVDSALAVFREAVQLDSTFAEAYSELGQIYEENGAYERALEAQQRALELDPENMDYRYYVGVLLFRLGRADEAIAHLERVKERRPWFYGVYYNLGRSLVAVGRTEEGERYLSMVDSLQNLDAELGEARATANVRDTPEAWRTYADLLYQSRQYERALEAYQVAHGRDPEDTTAARAISELRELLHEQGR